MVVASFSISGITAYQQQPTHHNYKHHTHYGNPITPIVNNTTTPIVNNSTVPPIVVKNNTTAPIVNNSTVPVVNTTKPVENTTVPTGATIVKPGSNIQTAINNAKAGSTIIVESGTYNEDLTINKQLNLIANGSVNIGTVSIDANNVTLQGFKESGDYAVVVNAVSGVQILGNTITSSLNGIMGEGIVTNLLVKDNTLIGTNPMYGNNMAFEGITNDAQILNNVLSGAEFGILFDVASTDNLIQGNLINGNGNLTHPNDPIVTEGVGIYTVDGSTNFKILNNTIINSRDSIAVQQIGTNQASNFLVEYNTVENSYDAIWMAVDNSLITNNTFTNLVDAIDVTGTGNTISNNVISASSNCDIALTTTASNQLNTLINNTFNGLKLGKYYFVGPGKVVGA